MGSSLKGGGQGGTLHYNATIACLVAKGPLYSLSKIILNGEVVWTGPIYRSGTTNPVNIVTKYGTGHWYWGTEDQVADPILDGYEDQDDLAGMAYFVFADFDHGQSPNAYNAEFIFRAKPDQDVITGGAAECDGNFTVNPIALAAEILTSPAWLGLPASQLVAETFQAVADDVQSEIVTGGRSASAMSPLYDDQREIREILKECAGLADAWLRVRADGKIECGRWRRDSNPPSVTTLTFDDLSELPQITTDDASQVPNSYAVEFRDSEALHKDAKIAVDDLAGIAEAGTLRRKTMQAPFLLTYDQALRGGQEALRRTAASSLWHGQIRRPKAVTPAGARLQPGDYIRAPLSAPGAVLVTGLIRIEKVKIPRNATDPVEIEGHVDAGAAAALTTAAAPVPATGAEAVLPPINRAREFSLPALASGSTPGVHLLCCKPQDDAFGFDVHYDDDPDGDFPIIGRQTSFALPATLDTAIAADGSSVRLSLLPAGANGERYDRDSGFLRNWSGGLTQGRNDELLILLFAVNLDGSIAAQETLSVAGAPTLVDADTWDIPVLRGRLGTVAQAFVGGDWSACEGWVAPRASMVAFQHADFSVCEGKVLYFRPGAYALRRSYAPDTAYAERQRRTTAEEDLLEYAAQPDADTWVPEYSMAIPEGFCPPPPGGEEPGTPETYPDIATIGAGPIPLSCRAKSGYACLCGFEEFTDPSSPPKRYRTRTKTGTLDYGRFAESGCQQDGGHGGRYSLAGGGVNGYGTYGSVGYATIDQIDTDAHTARFTATLLGALLNGDYCPAWAVYQGNQIAPGGSIIIGWAGTVTNEQISVKFYDPAPYHGWAENTAMAAIGGHVPELSCQQVNDLTQSYDADTCELTEEDDTTEKGEEWAEYPYTGAVDRALPSLASFLDVEETKTTRTSTGAATCQSSGGKFVTVEGKADEALSEEDTMEDAMARAMGAASVLEVPDGELDASETCAPKCCCAYVSSRTGAGGSCAAFRKVKVQPMIGPGVLVADHDYEVTIHFMSRPYGSGDFVPAGGDVVISFTADADDVANGWRSPDWYEVPCEEEEECCASAEMEDVTT